MTDQTILTLIGTRSIALSREDPVLNFIDANHLISWSYQDLYLRAHKVAVQLQQQGLAKGDRVLILLQPRKC